MNWPAHLNVENHVSLAQHTSWLVGGPAEFFAEPKSIQDLKDLQECCDEFEIPTTLLGGGTNVLVSDAGVAGLVISLGKFIGIEIAEENPNLKLWALAGTAKSELLRIYLKFKLAPALFLAGLPGQVGGGVVMNAGISESLKPREFVEIVEAIEVLKPDGKLKVYKSTELNWSYRHCEGWYPGVITRVLFSWENAADPEILAQVKKLNQLRLQKQPLEWPSCGSVFRNPLPQSSGKLIEDAGLKGFAIGGAQVSEKHANFIVNKGGATAADIRTLMNLCVEKVFRKSKVELVSEVVWLE